MEAHMIWQTDGWEDDQFVRDLLMNDHVLHHGMSLLPLPQPVDFNDTPSSNYPQSVSSPSSSSSSLLSDNIDDQEQIFVSRPLIPTVYSGPTLTDIATALSVTSGSCSDDLSHSRLSTLDKGLSKTENKYTLKIKSSGIGMADDGYKWRKYGQKSIKNSPNPRSYYKCTNPRCGAKKQVERSTEEPDTLIITYEGLHLHFAYPYSSNNQTQQVRPPSKKPKKAPTETQEEETNKAQESPRSESPTSVVNETFVDYTQKESIAGLLQDVVPVKIRNPSSDNSNIFTATNSSCSSSYSSPPTSPSSLSWSPFFPTLL